MVSLDAIPVDEILDASKASTPFEVHGPGLTFAPRYTPERMRYRKARSLDRKQAFCEGEDVSDTGSENREFHVFGEVLRHEKKFVDKLLDLGEPVIVSSATWTGEAYLADGEIEGPMSYDPVFEEWKWDYTLDFVSSGRDEDGNITADGVVSDGQTAGASVDSEFEITEPFGFSL